MGAFGFVVHPHSHSLFGLCLGVGVDVWWLPNHRVEGMFSSTVFSPFFLLSGLK